MTHHADHPDRRQPLRHRQRVALGAGLRSLFGLALLLGAVTPAAQAAQGLAVKQADELWPQWQARISIATSGSTYSGAGLGASWHGITASRPQRAALGAAVLGDLTLASPSFGSFRASGGLLVGGYRSLPSAGATAMPLSAKLSLAMPSYSHGLAESGGGLVASAAASTDALPYLGVGFSSVLWHDSLALSADMGWVSERPSAAAAAGRALFGNQGFDGALREMRLSPVLQLSLRYRF